MKSLRVRDSSKWTGKEMHRSVSTLIIEMTSVSKSVNMMSISHNTFPLISCWIIHELVEQYIMRHHNPHVIRKKTHHFHIWWRAAGPPNRLLLYIQLVVDEILNGNYWTSETLVLTQENTLLLLDNWHSCTQTYIFSDRHFYLPHLFTYVSLLLRGNDEQ